MANKRGNVTTGTNHRVNIADDIQTVLSEFHEHPFMQEIIQTKGKPPSAILYLEDNLDDISSLCSPSARQPSVLGIDRTFNLGPCFATILVYHNTNLIRKGTTNPPIMLGAVYLHWDALYTTYHRFLSHLQSRLSANVCAVQTLDVVVGSDEETALTKAIKQCFPSAHHLLCTRHLQENVRKYLSDKVGANAKMQRKIIKDIFGEKGLSSRTNEADFEVEAIKLEDEYGVLMPSFVRYFTMIVEKIRNGILLPRKNNKWVPIDWKNNSCESMNHIIKLSMNWKKMKVPDLIERLYKLVKLQQVDTRRALYGQGNYELAPWMASFKVAHVDWVTKTDKEKEKHYEKFKKGKPKTIRIVSTDGKLTVPRTATTAKKPGQRKRAKTTTIKRQ